MASRCYLCGKEIAEGDVVSDDHAVPQQLIARQQPKVKGFDYGGYLPTHEPCNNEFGPETHCRKALTLISILYDPECVRKFQHKSDPSIVMLALNSECLRDFTHRDLAFFKFIDVRDKTIAEFSRPEFFAEKPKTNPVRDALFTALAVLTKSAAALLVSRHLAHAPVRWRVLAIPYTGATDDTDFDQIFGDTKPFDIGVKVWLRPFETGDWFALYRAYNILVFLLFRFSDDDTIWTGMCDRFKDAERLCFEGSNLNELINYRWKTVQPFGVPGASR
ncbi:hypothetical protein [Sulfuritalea sp.]|uniref:hypothetical protein n=1 Tax=Sulfuritalea sp. TaxID=2480090 RepID=UPI00286E50F5|nr:hypothetical protein [Sulfuritalea sp.]